MGVHGGLRRKSWAGIVVAQPCDSGLRTSREDGEMEKETSLVRNVTLKVGKTLLGASQRSQDGEIFFFSGKYFLCG